MLRGEARQKRKSDTARVALVCRDARIAHLTLHPQQLFNRCRDRLPTSSAALGRATEEAHAFCHHFRRDAADNACPHQCCCRHFTHDLIRFMLREQLRSSPAGCQFFHYCPLTPCATVSRWNVYATVLYNYFEFKSTKRFTVFSVIARLARSRRASGVSSCFATSGALL